MSDDFRDLLIERSATHWWHTGMRANTWAFAGAIQGRVLDIGCGPGQELAELPDGAWGVGVDLYFLRSGHEVTATTGFVQADAGELPFAAAVFDWVLALDVLEQRLVVPAGALREARRVLRPGGRLLARVPAHPWLCGPHDAFWGGARRFRRAELQSAVRAAGFRIRRLSYANTLLFLPTVIQRLLARVTGWGADDMKPVPGWLSRLLLKSFEREARWLRRHDLPVGVSLLCLAEA